MNDDRQGINAFSRTNQEAQANPELLLFTRRMYDSVLDLLFPPRCVVCDRVDHVLCPRCAARLDEDFAIQTVRASAPLNTVIATGWHTGAIRHAIKAMKYASDLSTARRLADYFAARLTRAYASTPWHIDQVVPVPLHTNRQRQRGYNQAFLVASAFARQNNLYFNPNLLIRQLDTPPQVGKSRAERQHNMLNAFLAQPSLGVGNHVLLIDDVCTTGATLAACAAALKGGGVGMVYGMTITAARRTSV